MAERERIARVLIEAHQNAPDDASVFYLMADALLAAREGTDKPQWLCEFCYARLYVHTLPDSWEWVWQSAVCPECRVRVAQDGGYHVVKGGAYAEVPDPRPWTDLRAQLATAKVKIEDLLNTLSRMQATEHRAEQAEARVLEVQRERDEMRAAHARALGAAGEREGALRARLIVIQHTDRWCICPFSVADYPHITACPLGIATELLALLAPAADRGAS